MSLMAEHTIQNPDKTVSNHTVNNAGTVYLGDDFAGETIEFAVKILDDGEGDDDE